MELTSSTLVDKLMPELSTLFDTIRDQSRDGAGVTRDAFGPRETQAADTLAAFARRKGLEAGSDSAGNLHVTAAGALDDPPRIMLGSHLDSVPVGGNYDGLAGVIAGLAVLCLLDRGMATKAGVRVVGFRGEESPWFSQAYLGSKLLLGEFAREDLDSLRRYDTGKTLAEHLRSIGGSLGSGKLRPTNCTSNRRHSWRISTWPSALRLPSGATSVTRSRPAGVITRIRAPCRDGSGMMPWLPARSSSHSPISTGRN